MITKMALALILLTFLCGSIDVGKVSSGSIPSFSGPIPLPKTGQTTFFYPGDDGDLQKGIAWPNPRFQIDGDCILDKSTGLTWTKTPSTPMNWFQALTYTNGLTVCGKSGWRLPNVLELDSLIHFGQAETGSWLNSQGFNLGVCQYSWDCEFWTSTTYGDNTGSAYYINLHDGDISTSAKSTSGTYGETSVLAVQGGQQFSIDSNYSTNIRQTGQALIFSPGDDGDSKMGVSWPSPRFRDNNDGTVTDKLTMLVWLKDASCIKSQYPSYGDYFGYVNWQKSLDFIKGINDGTYSKCGANYKDWRLPNRIELLSLYDFSNTKPSLPSGHPFLNVKTELDWIGYWTSTTIMDSTTYAWLIRFSTESYDDISSREDKTSPIGENVWPVRGGLSTYLPNPLNFTAKIGVPLSAIVYSETVTIGGIDTSIPISITGGGYSINGGAFTAASGTVNNGNTVTVRQTSSNSASTRTDVTLNIAGFMGTFSVTTMSPSPIFLPLIIRK
jgi:hypothetical protein